MSTPRPHDYSSEKCWCGEINPLVKYPPKEGVAAPLEPSRKEFSLQLHIDWLAQDEISDFRNWLIEKLWTAAAVSKNLREELAARKQHIADIRARWGQLEGKEGCQCPICQKDFEAYMDWAEDMSMELHLPGGYKDRAEIAEARILELEKEITALREKPIK